MTIKEVLTIKVKKLALSSEDIDLLLEESGLVGSDTYNYEIDGKNVDLAYAGLLLTQIHVTEQKEDGVSIKFSTDMKGIYSAIMRKWGLVDPFLIIMDKPTVKQVNFW